MREGVKNEFTLLTQHIINFLLRTSFLHNEKHIMDVNHIKESKYGGSVKFQNNARKQI